jgi:putative exosortase-associated protein (TIGR04073 family)
MRKLIFPLAAVAVALLAAGCTGPEQKLGRGLSNCFEVIRWGELQSSIVDNTIEPIPGTGYYGAVHGFDKSIARMGLGVFEVATFPIPTPSYKPLFTNYLAANPVYPESYKPGRLSNSLFDTDTYTGFTGGDVAPWFPGSRFVVLPH